MNVITEEVIAETFTLAAAVRAATTDLAGAAHRLKVRTGCYDFPLGHSLIEMTLAMASKVRPGHTDQACTTHMEPLTWRDRWKEEACPKWLKRWLKPIEYKHTSYPYEIREICPHIELPPGDPSHLRFLVHGGLEDPGETEGA